MNDIVLVDSHCHFDLLEQDSVPIIESARNSGVKYFLNVSVALSRFKEVLEIALRYPFVFASVGLHPNNQDETVTFDELINLATDEKVVAIGETGLDYYRTEGDKDWQKERFRTHIECAKKIQKPLIIHTRQAKEDTILMMKTNGAQDVGGVMHCFTEDWNFAKAALDLGFYISFSGIVTFKNAKEIQEVATKVPLDRILIETDAPYLAPVPYRGKPNEPAFMYHTALFIAGLRNMSVETFAEESTNNFFALFKGANRNV